MYPLTAESSSTNHLLIDLLMMQMIADHYLGKAQLLMTGAESNLFKLAELHGHMTSEQAERWAQIKKDFLRNKAIGGADVGSRVVVVNQPVPGIDKILRVLAETIEKSIFPLVRSMDKKLDIDLRTHERMQDVLVQLRQLESEVIAQKPVAIKTKQTPATDA